MKSSARNYCYRLFQLNHFYCRLFLGNNSFMRWDDPNITTMLRATFHPIATVVSVEFKPNRRNKYKNTLIAKAQRKNVSAAELWYGWGTCQTAIPEKKFNEIVSGVARFWLYIADCVIFWSTCDTVSALTRVTVYRKLVWYGIAYGMRAAKTTPIDWSFVQRCSSSAWQRKKRNFGAS